MPEVIVNAVEGRTPEQKKALCADITAAVVKHFNAPLDAVTVTRRPEDQWPRRPICLLDRVTGVLALRPRETLTVLRHIFDIKPLRGTVLTYRWGEIGVEHRRFDVGRHAGDLHLKANLYLVPKAAKTGTGI